MNHSRFSESICRTIDLVSCLSFEMPPRKLVSKRARGGASSSRGVPRIEYDGYRFSDGDNFHWYNKLKDNNMIVERSIRPRIDCEVPIQRILINLDGDHC